MQRAVNTSNASETIRGWVGLYSDELFSWAFYKTRVREIAEDIVQDTFLSAVKSFEQFEGRSNPKTWLFSILNNKIIDHHRKVYKDPTLKLDGASLLDKMFNEHGEWRSDQRPSDWGNDDSHLLDNPEFERVLGLCLQKLPPAWFSAVQLKYIGEKNGEEICQELNITPSNFWQILHRAKLQVRKCVEMKWFNT